MSKLDPVRDGLRVLRSILAERLGSTKRNPAESAPSCSEMEAARIARSSLLGELVDRTADAPQATQLGI